ncbi:MAG: VWA domain-containing protein [Candidatus Omnitrophota bacterium]|jgi:Ca-activated chloride channel family protein|nr:MAG: VWA domain-containing protein [Candidatus Omnitrophota bacterium]
MKFASHEILNALWILLPLFFFLRWAWKQRIHALNRFGNLELVERLMEGISRKKQRAKLWLIFYVFAFSLLALARPLWGQKEQLLISRGHDIIVALDVSRSMLAEDIKPNRLARAKHEIASLIDRLQGNRIGLVIFAGEAFVQCPLTLDYAAAKILLNEIEIGSVPVPGTAISKAIEKSLESFPPGDRESRVLILITDGEDTVGDPKKSAEQAETEGVLIYAIGIGDPLGVPIPIRDSAGNLQEYVKDKSGNVVTSKLDEDTLRTVCLTTGGAYYPVRADSFELQSIYEHMEERRQQRLMQERFVSQEERFQYFLLPALICLLVEMLLSDRKRAPKRTVGGFQRNEQKVF